MVFEDFFPGEDVAPVTGIDFIKKLDGGNFDSDLHYCLENFLFEECVIDKTVYVRPSSSDSFFNTYVDFEIELFLDDGSIVHFNYRKFIESVF